jgi:hypothetical protein
MHTNLRKLLVAVPTAPPVNSHNPSVINSGSASYVAEGTVAVAYWGVNSNDMVAWDPVQTVMEGRGRCSCRTSPRTRTHINDNKSCNTSQPKMILGNTINFAALSPGLLAWLVSFACVCEIPAIPLATLASTFAKTERPLELCLQEGTNLFRDFLKSDFVNTCDCRCISCEDTSQSKKGDEWMNIDSCVW